MHSEQINELATALAKAQGQMRAAQKDAINPHLKNTYATLSSYIEAAREALSVNNLAFSQILSQADEGLILETLLMHSSGQWLQSEVLIRVAADNRGINSAQALGSALTYYKRYTLAALLGISVADEDDDGNGVEQPARKQPARNTDAPTNGKPKTPQPEQPARTGKATENPDAFFAKVQKATSDYYDSKEHLYNTLKRWPKFSDPDDIDAALSEAVDHARQKREVVTRTVTEDEIAF